MNIKQGQILESRRVAGKRKVLGICEDAHFLSRLNDYKKGSPYSYTIEELEEDFILPEEKWVPEDREVYWTIDFASLKDVYKTTFYGSFKSDKKRIAENNYFRTEQQAQTAYEKIKEVLR